MVAAVADLRVVASQGQQLDPVGVVDPRLALNERVAGLVAVAVVVDVPLSRNPAGELARSQPEREANPQALASARIPSELLNSFGMFTTVSCIATTS